VIFKAKHTTITDNRNVTIWKSLHIFRDVRE
jgi:hypothetical protein